jgi:hypothetical protein
VTTTPHDPPTDRPRRTSKPRREIIATDAPNTVAVQSEIPGTEQKKIEEIETYASKYEAKRAIINGLQDELTNIEFKLREAMHEHEDEVDKQESEDGDKLLVYKRGDYNVVVKRGKEKVNVKIKDASKGDVGEVDDDAEDVE